MNINDDDIDINVFFSFLQNYNVIDISVFFYRRFWNLSCFHFRVLLFSMSF